MNKKPKELIEEARADVAKLVRRSVRLAAAALKGRTADEARLAFNEPAKTAPKWTDLVVKVTGAASKSETEKPRELRQTLNVVMVERDSSTAAWTDRVKALAAVKAETKKDD